MVSAGGGVDDVSVVVVSVSGCSADGGFSGEGTDSAGGSGGDSCGPAEAGPLSASCEGVSALTVTPYSSFLNCSSVNPACFRIFFNSPRPMSPGCIGTDVCMSRSSSTRITWLPIWSVSSNPAFLSARTNSRGLTCLNRVMQGPSEP